MRRLNGNTFIYRLVKIVIAGLIIWGLFFLAWQHMYLNLTASLPRGYYFAYYSQHIKRGDVVVLCIVNVGVINFMHRRHLPYIKNACPGQSPYLLKQVVAISGDMVALKNSGVYVNGRHIDNSTATSLVGLPIGFIPIALDRQFILGNGEYWVMGRSSRSFDARYFGPVTRQQIHQKAVFLLPWWD